MTDEELDAIEQRANDATEGPWFVETNAVMNAARSYCVVPVGDSSQDITDSAFIACSRSDVPALVASLRATRSALRQLLAVAEVHHHGGFTNCSNCRIVRESRALVADAPQETK